MDHIRRSVVTGTLALTVAALVSACGHEPVTTRTLQPIPTPASGVGASSSSFASPDAAGVSLGPDAPSYTVQGSLPALTGTATAYRIATSVPDARVIAAAAALGVHGSLSPSRLISDGTMEFSSWIAPGAPFSLTDPTSGSFVCQAGGSVSTGVAFPAPPVVSGGPNVAVGPRPPSATVVPAPAGTDPSAAVPPPATCMPAPVTGLPSRASAERTAEDVLRAAGAALGDSVTVTATQTGSAWDVQLTPSVNGIKVDTYTSSVQVGAHGRTDGAFGYLASPVPAGDYPLAGTTVGLERLRQGRTLAYGVGAAAPIQTSGGVAVAFAPVYGGAPPLSFGAVTGQSSGSEGPLVSSTCSRSVTAPSSTVASPPAGPGSTGASAGYPGASSGPASAVAACPLTATGCGCAATQPPEVIKGVHLGLSMLPSSSGSDDGWLAPTYVFDLTAGFSESVLAVTDGYISGPVVAPPTTTGPSETTTTTAVGSVPSSVGIPPATLPPETLPLPGTPTTTDPPTSAPTTTVPGAGAPTTTTVGLGGPAPAPPDTAPAPPDTAPASPPSVPGLST